MPVQLNVRAPQSTSVNANQFGTHLSEQLRGANIDGKAALNALRDYVNSKAGTAQIRVVNTTKNQDLAFRVKAFGHNKAYRQERTAETLKQLLTRAGIKPDVASSVVDRTLQNNGNYRTATASMIQAVLNDPAVASVFIPPPSARRELPPLEIKPIQAPPFSPGDVLDSQFKSPLGLKIFKNLNPMDRNLHEFQHQLGGKVEYRDLSNSDTFVRVKDGRVIGEDALYEKFSHQFSNAQKTPAPPRTYLLQEKQNGPAQGLRLLVPRDELIRNPEFFNKDFTVLATVVPAKGEDFDLAASQAPGAFAPKSLDQYVVGASSPTFEVNFFSTTQKLDDFLSAQGLVTGAKLGAGAYGSVKNLGSAPGSSTHAVKYFTDTKTGRLKPVDLMAVRTTKQANEGYAAYLATSRDPQWRQPHVLAPSHYMVGFPNPQKQGTDDLKLIPIADLKGAVRLNASKGGPELKCYGLIMEKAAGQEISKQLSTTLAASFQRTAAAQSGLQTLRSLNTRGFVHRDIKPDNLMFDGKDVSFIDTGMLFKIKKTAADKPNPGVQIDEQAADQLRGQELPQLIAGTPFYMHKDLVRGTGYIGTQADLHAFALVILEMEAPKVLAAMVTPNMNIYEKPVDPDLFKTRLENVIQLAKADSDHRLLAEAKELQKNIADPSHLANLGFQCLEKADTASPEFTAVRWADRQFSDGQYVQLLSHPALG